MPTVEFALLQLLLSAPSRGRPTSDAALEPSPTPVLTDLFQNSPLLVCHLDRFVYQ